MASDYGLNFGFRRSDESMATREGRFKTPAAGDPLLIGTAVEIDPATPGYLKASAAAAAAVSGLRGILVQEESHLGSIFALGQGGAEFGGHDSLDLGVAKLERCLDRDDREAEGTHEHRTIVPARRDAATIARSSLL